MKNIVLVFMTFFTVNSFAFVNIKDISVESCNAVNKLLGSEISKLERAYYHSYTIFCRRKLEFPHLSNETWFSSKYYLKNINLVNQLISEANLNNEGIELIDLMRNKFYLTLQNHERLKKSMLKHLVEDSSYYEEGTHSFEQHVMAEELYTDIASRYYSNGMKEDGERVLNELRKIPHQYLPRIDIAQKRYEASFNDWKVKQEVKLKIVNK